MTIDVLFTLGHAWGKVISLTIISLKALLTVPIISSEVVVGTVCLLHPVQHPLTSNFITALLHVIVDIPTVS